MPIASDIVAGYRAGAAAHGRDPAPEPPGLEATLSRLYARGCAEHPTLRVEPASFGRHLAGSYTPVDGADPALPAGDLLLACAALGRDAGAISKITQIALPSIRSFLRRMEMSVDSANDIVQELWDVLLAPRAGRGPMLAVYSGTGSLRSFVGVIGRRLALGRCRHENVAARAATRAASEVNALVDDVELGFIKLQHREAFRQAIENALGKLDDRLRMVLRMRVVDGITVDAIAKMYGVAQSSASRWLEKARQQVLAETRRLLAERLLMSDSEFDSLWGLVVSQVEISVSGILACNAASRSGAA